MRLLCWAATDTGRKRDHNEDSFLVDDTLRLYAVADGMGGHQGGGHASKLALEVMQRELATVGGNFAGAAAEIIGRSRGLAAARIDPEEPTIEDIDAMGDTLPPLERRKTERPHDAPTDPALGLVQPVELVMTSAAQRAGAEIFDTAQQDAALQGMGTTLTACCFVDGVMHYVHAGDSRVYLFRGDEIRQVTEDHSWIWEQIKAGAMTEEEAKTSQFRHIITRSVGFEREVDVDAGGVRVKAGDAFVLCSDGMSNYVDAAELQRVLRSTWLRRAPQLLIDIANDRGGDDNITVVVIYAANDLG